MYFCPCPCNDPIDSEAEDHSIVSLPRNLSYVEESYLDKFSVSARFVHNPKIERIIRYEESTDRESQVAAEQTKLLTAAATALTDRSVGNCQDIKTEHIYCTNSETTQFRSREIFGKTDLSPSFGGRSSGTETIEQQPQIEQQSQSVKKSQSDQPSQTDQQSQSYQQQQSGQQFDITSPLLNTHDCPSNGFLSPVAKVASKLSYLLHSPPNESINFNRDTGSSVDGYIEISDARDLVLNPDLRSPVMDRYSEAIPHTARKSTDGCVDGCKISEDGDSDDLLTDTSNELFPKPFGNAGKTFFPRSDLDLSSSDQDSVGPEEDGKDIEDGSDQIESLVENNFVSKLAQSNKMSNGSPDSDVFEEEGVFLNMEDIDCGLDKSASVSEVSDDTYVSEDSVYHSPDENNLDLEGSTCPGRKMSLQEAIDRAASDLDRMTMYHNQYLPQDGVHGSDETLQADDSKFEYHSHNRSSPMRMRSGLKIKVTDQDGHEEDYSPTYTALSDSPIYPDDEFNFSRSKLRKSTSLKTNKTPPGTPHRKKAVRFADSLGLDLESVRHVLNSSSPPKIPASAMADLRTGLQEDRKEIGSHYLTPCFAQPGSLGHFFQKVQSQKVCLENAIITDITITGIVRVANISFDKSVRVRYTHNDWATFHDIAASYVQDSCDGATDRFSFSIVAPPFFALGSRLQFALSYSASGIEYWDNNDGHNYRFECFAKHVPTANETSWMHFL